MCALNRVRGHYHSLRDTSGETSLDFFVAKRLVCLRLLRHASGRKSDGAVAYPWATSLCARHMLTPGVCIPAFVLSELLLFLYPFRCCSGLFFSSESFHHLSSFSVSFTKIVFSGRAPPIKVGFPHPRTKFPPSPYDAVACFLVWNDLQWPFRALLTRRLRSKCFR